MHCVVGSGPSAVACAQALLDRGLEVRMLDAGTTLEETRARAVAKLAATAPEQWDPKLIELIKESPAPTKGALPQKLVYGSDFPYRASSWDSPNSFEGVGGSPSLAFGGLSNVWGAAMMPHREADLADWPITAAQLAEHYAAVLKLTGLSARRDDLVAEFPLHTDDFGTLDSSRQAGIVLKRMERHRRRLNLAGIEFGASRVAIRGQKTPTGEGCVYCGLCMYGCPYGYIYNSASTVTQLRQHPRFTYQPDTLVTALSESANAVTITARDLKTGEARASDAARVYLAAGAISTTKLLLQSRNNFDRTVLMRDSQYFLIPLLLFRGAPEVQRERLHALSQLFVELCDREISAHTIHLQLYSYSELIGATVRQTLRRFGLNSGWLANQVESRLVVMQGFLHSDDSSRIAITLRNSPGARLELKADLNQGVKATVRKVVRKLLRNAWHLGAVPVQPMVHDRRARPEFS